MVDGPDYQIPS